MKILRIVFYLTRWGPNAGLQTTVALLKYAKKINPFY